MILIPIMSQSCTLFGSIKLDRIPSGLDSFDHQIELTVIYDFKSRERNIKILALELVKSVCDQIIKEDSLEESLSVSLLVSGISLEMRFLLDNILISLSKHQDHEITIKPDEFIKCLFSVLRYCKNNIVDCSSAITSKVVELIGELESRVNIAENKIRRLGF